MCVRVCVYACMCACVCACVHVCMYVQKEEWTAKVISPSYATNIVGSRCTASESLWMAVLSSFFISATDAAIQYEQVNNHMYSLL